MKEAEGFPRHVIALVTTGVFLSGVAVPATMAANERYTQQEALYEAAKAEACGGDPAYDPRYHDSDETLLPPLDPTKFSYNEEGVAKLGGIVISDTARWAEGYSPAHIPDGYLVGLSESFEDPYVACTAQSYGEIKVAVHKDGFDQPGHVAADDVLNFHSRVELNLGTGDQSGNRVFEKQGSLRSVLTHEGSHEIFDKWTKNKDPENLQLLQELEDLYQQEYLMVNEQFRLTYGAEIITKLQIMKVQFDAQGISEVAQAIDATIGRYGREHGLDDIAFNSSRYLGHRESASIKGQVSRAANTLGLQVLEFGYEGIDLQAFYDAERLKKDYLSKAYAYVNEGQIIPFADGRGGHAAGSAAEKMASTVTSAQISPEEINKRLQLLDPTRRVSAERQQEIILGLFKVNNPSLLQFIFLKQVVAER